MKAPNYLLGSINQALEYGANCFMIYTGPNQSTIRTDISKMKIDEFKKIANNNNINLMNVIVHAPYILNLANGDPTKWSFSINFLIQELERTNKIGAKYFVLHPGNAVNIDRHTGLENIIKALNQIFERDKSNVVVCIETMSGKGTELGKDFQEIAFIINGIKNKKRIGVCLDTCHINDAGYDETNFDYVLDEFDKIIGLNYLKVLHINDSMNSISSHKDRHENIGYGHLGFELLNKIVHHPQLKEIPKILETPWYNGAPLYKEEIEMFHFNKWFDVKKTK